MLGAGTVQGSVYFLTILCVVSEGYSDQLQNAGDIFLTPLLGTS
jgi:hypothetical protein